MTWNREVDVRGPAGPEGAFPSDAARRTDPGYPTASASTFYEIVDERNGGTFVAIRSTDGAPTHPAGSLIAKTLIELGYTLSGGGGGGTTDPTGPFIAFGDSMTADDAWLGAFAADTSLTVRDSGEAGQSSTEVAFRAGALAVAFTVAGNQIPASGAVNVTALSPSGDWRTGVSASVRWSERGYLAGVLGTFYHQNVSFPAQFVRDKPGTAVSCPAGTPFLVAPGPKTGYGFERCPVSIWVGRNNVSSLATVQRDITALVARFPSPRKMILSVTNMSTEPSGSSGYNQVKAINDWLANTYPNFYVDVRKWLVNDALRDMGLTPTSEDTAAVNQDLIPPTLMNDSTHITAAASAALGRYLAFVYRERGI